MLLDLLFVDFCKLRKNANIKWVEKINSQERIKAEKEFLEIYRSAAKMRPLLVLLEDTEEGSSFEMRKLIFESASMALAIWICMMRWPLWRKATSQPAR